jgi:hypothetical protein
VRVDVSKYILLLVYGNHDLVKFWRVCKSFFACGYSRHCGRSWSGRVRALVRWGKFQVQKFRDEFHAEKLMRSNILPSLNLIIFSALNFKQFMNLWLGDLGSVITTGEKWRECYRPGVSAWNRLVAVTLPQGGINDKKKKMLTMDIVRVNACIGIGPRHSLADSASKGVRAGFGERATLVSFLWRLRSKKELMM